MLKVLSADESETKNKNITDTHLEETRRMQEWLTEKIAAGRKKAFAEVVTLTPVLAQLLLNRNPMNRPIAKRNIGDMRRDIVNKRFSFNGESMVVSDTGIFNDGQHRALTVLETGIPIQTVIVFGPKEETRFTVDIGRSKTAPNFLAMYGRNYPSVLSPAVNYYIQWKENQCINYGSTQCPTKHEVVEEAENLCNNERYPFGESVEFTAGSTKTVRKHAILAFCHYVFWHKTNRETSDEFIQRLIDGDGLRKGSPLYCCRNKLLNMGRLHGAGASIELIFKCWNAWRKDKDLPIDNFKLTGGKLPKLEP